ncbi:MAG: winged helix-turn-helix domain-containing protein [Pseudomonadota bacterium]
MIALEQDISRIASLIGDKARASILVALMTSKALTAGELAWQANISAQTASNHLKKLMRANLIICHPNGRHRYYHLASAEVAHALESLGVLTKNIKPPQHKTLDKAICFARSCYDHLAGELSIKLKNILIKKRFIEQQENSFMVTPSGERFFNRLGIDIAALKKQRRQFANPCLDWTAREYHIAGSLGAAILDYFLDNRLVIRSKEKPRVVVLTAKGKQWINQVSTYPSKLK